MYLENGLFQIIEKFKEILHQSWLNAKFLFLELNQNYNIIIIEQYNNKKTIIY